jgi:hypothetical protein
VYKLLVNSFKLPKYYKLFCCLLDDVREDVWHKQCSPGYVSEGVLLHIYAGVLFAEDF